MHTRLHILDGLNRQPRNRASLCSVNLEPYEGYIWGAAFEAYDSRDICRKCARLLPVYRMRIAEANYNYERGDR